VYERSATDPAVSGMGTTMTVALVEGDEVVIGHVGDSRAYRLRGGLFEQLTDDHSLVNELMKSGKLSPEEAETHPQRAVITRALGTDPDVDVDAFEVHAEEGDVYLICSDGLTTMVDDDDILALLEENHDDLPKAAKALVAAANKRGGEDNITVVAFRIDAPLIEPASELAETQTLPAADPQLEDTLTVPPPEVEAGPASEPAAARMRLALTMAGLLALAAILLVWGLVH
jgi:protein phosphatase